MKFSCCVKMTLVNSRLVSIFLISNFKHNAYSNHFVPISKRSCHTEQRRRATAAKAALCRPAPPHHRSAPPGGRRHGGRGFRVRRRRRSLRPGDGSTEVRGTARVALCRPATPHHRSAQPGGRGGFRVRGPGAQKWMAESHMQKRSCLR